MLRAGVCGVYKLEKQAVVLLGREERDEEVETSQWLTILRTSCSVYIELG